MSNTPIIQCRTDNPRKQGYTYHNSTKLVDISGESKEIHSEESKDSQSDGTENSYHTETVSSHRTRLVSLMRQIARKDGCRSPTNGRYDTRHR